MEKQNKFVKIVEKPATWVWAVILTIGICFILIPILITSVSTGIAYNKDSADIGSTFGGISSPLLALAGIFLTFAAFYIQYKANLQQSINFHLQLFESKFFDLLKIHRENVGEMNIMNKLSRHTFVILRAEFQDIYDVAKKHLAAIKDENNRIKQDVSYLFLFYGIGDTTSPMVKDLTRKYQIDDQIEAMDKELKEVQKCTTPVTKNLAKYEYGPDGYMPFRGHQVRLAHYYRHLYHTVLFVEEDKVLNTEQKKKYMQMLRAQFGTHEVALFFYNSLSSIGSVWKKEKWLDDTRNKQVNLVTKYEMIRHLPTRYFTYDLPPEKYYPDINYQWDELFEMKSDDNT